MQSTLWYFTKQNMCINTKQTWHFKYWRIIMIYMMKAVAFVDNQLFKFDKKNGAFMFRFFASSFYVYDVCLCV